MIKFKNEQKWTCASLQFMRVRKMNRFKMEHIWKLNDFENGNKIEKWMIFKMGTVLKKDIFNKWSN
jgi:hypothetical protein